MLEISTPALGEEIVWKTGTGQDSGRIFGIGKTGKFLVEGEWGPGSYARNEGMQDFHLNQCQKALTKFDPDKKYYWINPEDVRSSTMKQDDFKTKPVKPVFDVGSLKVDDLVGVVDLKTGTVLEYRNTTASKFNYGASLYLLHSPSNMRWDWVEVNRLRPASEIGKTDPTFTDKTFGDKIKEALNKNKETQVDKQDKQKSGWEAFTDTIKEDFAEGTQLVAGETAMLGLQKGILLAMQARGASVEQMRFAKNLFDSEYGKGAMEIALGFALMYVPGVKDQKAAKYLAKGARVDGFRAVGSQVKADLFQFIAPALMDALSGETVVMPDLSEYEEKQVRVDAQAPSAQVRVAEQKSAETPADDSPELEEAVQKKEQRRTITLK